MKEFLFFLKWYVRNFFSNTKKSLSLDFKKIMTKLIFINEVVFISLVVKTLVDKLPEKYALISGGTILVLDFIHRYKNHGGEWKAEYYEKQGIREYKDE